MPYHGIVKINKPKWTNTWSNSTIKALKQLPRILMWCLYSLTLLYFFSGRIFVGVQQDLSDAIQSLDQHTIRYELNQNVVQLKFILPSSLWLWLCMEAMVNFTNRLKEIVQIFHWVGSILAIKQIFLGNLFLLKVTRMEALSIDSFRESLGRS